MPDMGLTGDFAVNTRLAELVRWELDGVGPEDVAVASDGTVYTGLADGRIMQVRPSDGQASLVCSTGGRPLGIEVDADGTLVVCDAYRGLLRVHPGSGEVVVLADALDGVPLRLVNNADICADGSVLFTESSTRFALEHFKADLLEHRCTGRLLRWHPDGSVEVLLGGLAFANGVALAADESHVLVAETGAYRIRRLWLTGPSAGHCDVLISNLPGFPDNLSTGSAGLTWVAIASTRNRLLDLLLPLPGFLRMLVWALPERLQPEASRISLVLAIDADGEVVHNLQGDGSRYHYVTGVREYEGWLYLGSLADSAIASVTMPG
jgi:sugar lactone lactonase YvrE